MYILCPARKNTGLSSIPKRHRSKPCQVTGYIVHDTTTISLRCPKASRETRRTKQIHLTISRAESPLHQNTERDERLCLWPKASRSLWIIEVVHVWVNNFDQPRLSLPLLLYIASSHNAVSAALVHERTKKTSHNITQSILYLKSLPVQNTTWQSRKR